jgi:hypothetical protein
MYTGKILDLPGIAGGKQKNTMVTMAKMAAKALTNAKRSASFFEYILTHVGTFPW